jgi:L-threonylcarbamoyladenylate synthase
VAEAVAVLRAGGVVAYPTETFYGLAVDPRSSDAVRRLFMLKGRPETSALTLIAADLDQGRQVGFFNRTALTLAEQWWPGPLTIVVPAGPGLAAEVLAGGATVGVRVSGSEVARTLARAYGNCITATSANRSGEPPAAHADEVAERLPGVDLLIDDGAAPGGAPSTIVAVTSAGISLVRAGAIAWERVLRSLESA